MNLLDLFVKIGVDSKDAESGIKKTEKSSKSLVNVFAKASTESKTLENKIKVLSAQYDSAKANVEKLTTAFNESIQKNGSAAKETQELAEKLKDAEENAGALKNEMDKLSSSANNTSSSFAGLKSGLATAGKIAATGIGLVVTAAGAAVGGLLALEGATEEYRIAQGKLNTAFEAAGYSADTAQTAYTGFYSIIGDTDTATEASQLLAKLAQSEEDMARWTDIAAGVYGTFGDALPIEGLIEASNETAKVGQVTGTLADALNWAGISEDEFNAQLASCGSEAERNQLIMNTLSGTYDGATEAFYRNNEALVSSRQAQVEMDNALASLGGSISSIKTRVMSDFLPGIAEATNALAGMLSGTEGADEQFSAAIQGLIGSFTEQLPEFMELGVSLLQNIIMGLVQAIPSVVEQLPTILSTVWVALQELFPVLWEAGGQLLLQIANGIVTYVPMMLEQLPTVITSTITWLTNELPKFFEKGQEVLQNLLDGIIAALPVIVEQLPEMITAIVNFITANLPQIIQMGVELLVALTVGLIQAIPQLVMQLPQIIWAIVQGIASLMYMIGNIGQDIVRGIWDGIQQLAGWLTSKVRNFFSGIVNGVKDFLGIHSPSTVFAEMGGNMAEGVGVGWDKTFGGVKKDIEDGLSFDTDPLSLSATMTTRRTSSYGDTYSQQLIAAIDTRFDNLIDRMRFDIVLDGKTLVGRLAPKIDSTLGTMRAAQLRGV